MKEKAEENVEKKNVTNQNKYIVYKINSKKH